MRILLVSLAFLLAYSVDVQSQRTDTLSWWNPSENDFEVIEGQAWPNQVEDTYDRLPVQAKSNIRDAVWNLSRHSSGLMIRFRTNAENISVRYQLGSDIKLNHMPDTGSRGLDMYAIDSDGKWKWCRGRRSFKDTISYRFNQLAPNDNYHELGREYRLYLPLFNSVSWLEIGVAEEAHFRPLPVRPEKPIVVYGTSITHGACASRPGMSWANILGRKMDRPLINLGFSGNGRLEKEVVDFVQEIDAKIFILDCLPNLWNAESYDDEELTKRILNTVGQLKSSNPNTPILIVEHAGYTDGEIEPDRKSFIRV